MTYKELIEQLQTLTAEQLAADVTVYVRGTDEFYPVAEKNPLCIAIGDVIDEDSPYLVI